MINFQEIRGWIYHYDYYQFTTTFKENTVFYKGLQLQKNLCLYFSGVSDKILCYRLKRSDVWDSHRIEPVESSLQTLGLRTHTKDLYTPARKEIRMHSKRYILLICLMVALPFLVYAESDIPGWGKAKWGMSHSKSKTI